MTINTMPQKELAIIILNWNGWRDTIDCLESLLMNTWQDFSVYLIDNGSQDNSLQKIKSWAHNRVGYGSFTLDDFNAGRTVGKSADYRLFLVRSEENHG